MKSREQQQVHIYIHPSQNIIQSETFFDLKAGKEREPRPLAGRQGEDMVSVHDDFPDRLQMHFLICLTLGIYLHSNNPFIPIHFFFLVSFVLSVFGSKEKTEMISIKIYGALTVVRISPMHIPLDVNIIADYRRRQIKKNFFPSFLIFCFKSSFF